MKKLREVCRLKFELGYSNRSIARSIGISASTVSSYVNLFQSCGLSWQEVSQLNEGEFQTRLLPTQPNEGNVRPLPDWSKVHVELQRKGVTMQLLWSEYKAINSGTLGYTQFTKRYREYAKTLDPVMRLTHRAGEKVFVDYAGVTMHWTDQQTGERHEVQIFVGALGASNLIFAEATQSQQLPDWIGSHCRMFEYFGGVTETVVPDNLKSGVIKAHRYDPDINQTYTAFAEHYNVAVIPARAGKPRDKGKVESAVQIVERQIIAALRNITFWSLREINEQIRLKLNALNEKPMQRLNISRFDLFNQIEQDHLKPLPLTRFEIDEWRYVKVNIDYHVCINKHFYSVPFALIGKQLTARITDKTIVLYDNSNQVAIHRRENSPSCFSTLKEHMPAKHRAHLDEIDDESVQKMLVWANGIGANTKQYVTALFDSRLFPQQAIRATLGLRRLSEKYGIDAFEKACEQGLALSQYRYETIEEILKNHLQEKISLTTTRIIQDATYFRGAHYFKN